MCSGRVTFPANHSNRAPTLSRILLPLFSCLTEKYEGTREQPLPETTGMRGSSKTVIKISSTKQNTRLPETWWEKKKNKPTLIIKCCSCKTKNRTVPSGHNSPGKPSTYLTDWKQCLCMEEERRLHMPTHQQSPLQASLSRHGFSCWRSRHLRKPSAVTERICLSH